MNFRSRDIHVSGGVALAFVVLVLGYSLADQELDRRYVLRADSIEALAKLGVEVRRGPPQHVLRRGRVGAATPAQVGLVWGFDPDTAGYSNIVNRPWRTMASNNSDRGTGSFPDKTGGSEGWDGVEWDDVNLSVTEDLTAPLGDSVLQMRYPAGTTAVDESFSPGVAQTQTFQGAAHGGLTLTELYVRSAFKLSADWEQNPNGTKLPTFVRAAAPAQSLFSAEPFLALTGTTEPYGLVVNFQGTPDGELQANPYPATPTDSIQHGQWYRYEIQAVLSSGLGVADGIYRLWIDGTLVLERTDVDYWPEDGSWYWQDYHMNPIWGGQGGTRTTEFFQWSAPVQIWGT